MTRVQSSYHIIPPSTFLKLLFGLWFFFTLSLGAFSDWVFNALMPDVNDVRGDGYIYSGIYAFLLLGLFGATWYPLNRKFPLQRPRNLIFHGIAQTLNSLTGYILGFFVTGYLHMKMYGMKVSPDEQFLVVLAIIALMCLIGILLTNGVFYVIAYVKRSEEAERRRVESELSALRAQINPHFLFNSLNSIAALIRISPEKAETVTEDLADVFRYTLQVSEYPSVCLKDELEIIQLYLNIEKARFGERLEVIIEVPDSLYQTSLPVLTLQPLVENAIKHGVSRKEGKHTVTIKAQKHLEVVELRIQDTGLGFGDASFEELLQKGTGLSNVFRRLNLHFGDEADGSVSGNTLTLRFPELSTGTHLHLDAKRRLTI